MTRARGAWPLAFGVTAGVAAAGLAVLVYVDPRPTVHMTKADAGARPATAPAAWAPSAASVASSRPVWLRPVPPAIVLPPGDEIDEAVRPWQAGNYAGAAMWLEALAREHQEIPMLDFYAGVAWLLAKVPADAVPALERALARAPDDAHGEIAWYLGLAHLELEQFAAARTAFDAACEHGAGAACRALTHVDGALSDEAPSAAGGTVEAAGDEKTR